MRLSIKKTEIYIVKINKKNLTLSSITVFISLMFIFLVASAGSITPTGIPDATFYTLQDIYNKMTGVVVTPHINLKPAVGPGSTMVNLTQIYNAISTIVANKVLYGTTYMGRAGTANTPPGSGTEATNSDLASGLYAFKSDGTTIIGSAAASLVWQTDPNQTLCHDADAFASSNGCSTVFGFLENANYPTNPQLLGAREYCEYLATDGTTISATEQDIWRLPTQAEIVIAMAEYFMPDGDGNVSFTSGSSYWTSSLAETNQYYAANGSSNSVDTNSAWTPTPVINVRCVK
jgi:hypothetical protein